MPDSKLSGRPIVGLRCSEIELSASKSGKDHTFVSTRPLSHGRVVCTLPPVELEPRGRGDVRNSPPVVSAGPLALEACPSSAPDKLAVDQGSHHILISSRNKS